MPYEILRTQSYLTFRFFGAVTSDDLQGLAQEGGLIEAACDPTPHRLTDLSASEMVNLDFVAVEALAARRRVAPMKNPVKSAIVAPRPVQYGLARMFQTLNDNPQIDVAIFRDLSSAVAWIEGASGEGAVSG